MENISHNNKQCLNKARKLSENMMREYPRIYDFLIKHATVNNSRRFGVVRIAFLYSMLNACDKINSDTTPRDLGNDPEVFWDLADAATSLFPGERCYAVDTVIYLYLHLNRKRMTSPAFACGCRSPKCMLNNKDFRNHLIYSYIGRERVFILRHGRRQTNAHFLVLDYRNTYLRDLLIESIIRWPKCWEKRTPHRINLLKDAEEWFEGTTDGLSSWEQFDATMLDTAKRHIIARYEGEWRKDAMRFLFHFYGELLLTHPEHHFFENSYIWCAELILNKCIPGHLAEGYEIGVFGQKDPFLQGKGVLFVVYNADLMGASNRRIEIHKYDLSKLTVPGHWNALANFLLENKRDDILYARHFFIWLANRKRAISEDPLHITKEDLDAFRLHIIHKINNSGSRNRVISTIIRILRWMESSPFLHIEKNALDNFGYFPINRDINPQPLTKENAIAILRELEEMAKDEPRYKLTSIIFRLQLAGEIRSGAYATLTLDDLEFLDDGSCKVITNKGYIHDLAKNTGRSKTTFLITSESVKLILKAIELTDPIRAKCPLHSIKRHIFLYENKSKTKPFEAMTIYRYNLDLNIASKRIGGGHITSGMIRDTMFTQLDIFMIKKGIPDYKKAALTHHASPRSIRSYAIITINDILEHSPRVSLGHILTH